MALEFTLPDVGEGVAEGEIVQWLVGPGDPVSEDQPVVEVETDKAVVEVPSPVNGSVKELRAEAGDVVPVGDVIIVFEVDGEREARSASDGATGEGTEPGAPEDVAAAAEPEPADDEPTATDADGLATPDGEETEPVAPENGETTADSTGGRVFAAPSARRLARELDVDIAAVDGSGPGGRVTEMDVRVAAEDTGEEAETATDSDDGGEGATAEPASDDEPTAEREAAIAEAEEPVGGAQPSVVEGTQPTTEDAGADADGSPQPAGRDRTLAAPATRGTARELGVDVNDVPATETREGEAFVTAEAVEAYAESQRAAQQADAEAVSAESTADDAVDPSAESAGSAGPETGVSATGEDERVPYRGVRRTIGQQMERSKFTAPHVTHHDQVDVTELVETRTDLKDRAADRGVELTYLPFVLKAVVAGLQEYPILNSQLDEENEEILKRGDYNVGVATATDAGLMVPVVEDVDRKSLLDVAAETNDLVARARDRSIAREEMQGGTFTVTNFGAIGGEYATPIINHPETAILGLGAVKKRPWVVTDDDGTEEVVPRHVMTLSLSIDHRVIDGAEAARFVNTVTEYLRDPTLLLLE